VILGQHPVTEFQLGPGFAFVSSEDGFRGFVGLEDGKPIANTPSNVLALWAHPAGFLLAASTEGGLLFGTSLNSWRKLPIQGVSDAMVDHDSFIVIDAQDRALRVSSKGTVSPISLQEGIDRHTLRLRELEGQWYQPSATGPAGPPAEGSLLDGLWAPTLRADDEWFGVQNNQVYLLRAGSGELKAIGAKLLPDEGDCGPKVLSGKPLLVCTTLGSRLRVLRLDLVTGARTAEVDVRVTQGQAYQVGDAPVFYPQTLFITSNCRGDATGGLCIRDSDGSYATFHFPGGKSWFGADARDRGAPYVFPGEMLLLRLDAAGALSVFRGSDGAQYHFDASTLRAASTALRWAEAAKGAGMPPFLEAGALRTPTSLRLFYDPNPFQPLPAAPLSYALDLALDGTGQARLLPAPGVVAAAGAHGLRLDRDKLYETNDGWSTWYEVAPPPSGVPSSLAGARCDDRGCTLGPWTRIGWERPSLFP
jgi:hypothetical protein